MSIRGHWDTELELREQCEADAVLHSFLDYETAVKLQRDFK